MRAHAGHAVEHAHAGAGELDLGAQGWIAIRDHPQRPRPVAPAREHFGRGQGLVAGAERADPGVVLRRGAQESARTLGPFGRDDDPSSHDWISAELGHAGPNLAKIATQTCQWDRSKPWSGTTSSNSPYRGRRSTSSPLRISRSSSPARSDGERPRAAVPTASSTMVPE